MFTKKERKAAKYFLEFIPNAKWIQRSWQGKIYLINEYSEIIIDLYPETFKDIGNGQTWSLKTISEGKVK